MVRFLTISYTIVVVAGTLLVGCKKSYQDPDGNRITIVKPSFFSKYYYLYLNNHHEYGSNRNEDPLKIDLAADVRTAFTDSTIVVWISDKQKLELPNNETPSSFVFYYGYEEVEVFNKEYFSPSNSIWEWDLYEGITPLFWNHTKWEPCVSP